MDSCWRMFRSFWTPWLVVVRRGGGEEDGPVGLVVLDSVAGLFRSPDAGPGPLSGTAATAGTGFYSRRATALFRASACLRRLADLHGVAVVVTNQATAKPSSAATATTTATTTATSSVPALGLAWSSCVNSRYILERSEGAGGRFRRWATVVKSPRMPRITVPFRIEKGGGVASSSAAAATKEPDGGRGGGSVTY